MFPSFVLIFLNICYWSCYYSYPKFPLFAPLQPGTPPFLPAISSNFSSCPWIMPISSLATPSPMLLSKSPCLFCTYHFVLLNPCTFPSFFPFPLPTGNPPNDLHIYESVSVLLVCLVCFLDLIVDSYEFIAILMFIVLIFFFLNESL